MNGIVVNGRLIDLETGELRHGDESLQLAPRLAGLLKFLVDHPNRVISRDELIEAVWGHIEAASDDSVNVAISTLRQRIGDGKRPHKIIKAVPRRGYRFDARHVRALEGIAPGTSLEEISLRMAGLESPRTAGRRPIGLMAILGLVVVAGWWLLDWPSRNGESALPVVESGAQGTIPASAPSQSVTEPGPYGRAVAVLPFADMSVGGNQGPFADGLVDRIIHKLTLSPELDVMARTSTFAFRDSQLDIRAIAERLEVDVVLEGSVQHADNMVRVLAQLIDARNGMHIWSRTYDRPIGELFALQDEIANAVARTMTSTLLPERDTPGTDSRRVLEQIILGRLAMDRLTLAAAGEAESHFRRALSLQPDNVEALIGMADAMAAQAGQAPRSERAERLAQIELIVDQARSIAPDSHLVTRATADNHLRHRRHDEAIALYQRAIELNPNDAESFRQLGHVLFHESRFDDAIDALRSSLRLDPLSDRASVMLADAYWAVGRAEEAVYRLRQMIAERPEHPQAYNRLATYLVQQGHSGEAMRHVLRLRELDPDSPFIWFRKCEFYLHLADDVSAERCANELLAHHDIGFRADYLRQIIHGFRGQWDRQREYIEAIVASGESELLTQSLLVQARARSKDCDGALDAVQTYMPVLIESPDEMRPNELFGSFATAWCLQQTGQDEMAERLLNAMESMLMRIRLDRGPWLISGLERGWLHALRGEWDEALDEFERLIDSGWRYYWWGWDGYPYLEVLWDHPRFIELMARLEDGVQAQRNYFEAHRHLPLN